MKRLALTLAATLLPWTALDAAGTGKPRPDKAEGYLEYRQGEALIVDGQRVLVSPTTRLELKDGVASVDSIPLGCEVKAKGLRQPGGALVAKELQAKKNGSALFESDVRTMTDEAEARYRRAGRFYSELDNGRTETVGQMLEAGPRHDRARRMVDSLLPPYVDRGQVRVYVIENAEWNAFAMGNYSIYVFSGLLDDLDDDELAIVLGHETAHATHEHTRRQFKKAMWIQIAALGVSAAAEEIDDRTKRVVARLLVAFAASAWRNGYGRDLEDQADRVGLRYAYEAGYDITKGPRLWERFARKYGEPGKVANFFFGDHSLASRRAVNLQRQIALNYADGPKDGGPRYANSPAKTPASSVQPAGEPLGVPPAGAAALARPGAGVSSEIRPGMSREDVRALLGEPREVAAAGARTTWTYADFTVVFEAGRVVDVKF